MVYGLFRALPGDQALLSPSSANMVRQDPVGFAHLHRLDASIGASEPHDFTVREKRLSSACHSSAHGPCRPALPSPDIARRCRVHRIPPRVRDDRDTPLKWDETMRISELICLGPKQKYFCKRGWTGHFGKHEVICPSGKITARTEPRRDGIGCVSLIAKRFARSS